MPANFLHGVETIEVLKGPRPIRQVKTAVVGLIGTAPTGAVNKPTIVLSERDAAAFGASPLPTYSWWWSTILLASPVSTRQSSGFRCLKRRRAARFWASPACRS